MELLNININDYSDTELEEILSLEYPYVKEDIITNREKLYKKLVDDDSVEIITKNKIHTFLNKISHRLEQIISKGMDLHNERDHFKDLKNTVHQVNDHFVIVKEAEKQEAYSSPPTAGLNIGNDGGAPPGIINPIKYRTIKKALNIDSKFRPNYYQTSASDQHLTLPYKFENVINMRLASIELPMSFYAISQGQGNNCFRVDWDLSGEVIGPHSPGNHLFKNSVLVKIPDGNYNTFVTTPSIGVGGGLLESAINAALNASTKLRIANGTGPLSPQTIQSDPNFNLKYTVDSISGRSIFALDVSGIPTSDLSTLITTQYLAYQITFGINVDGDMLHNQPLPFFLGWQLGYRIIKYWAGAGTVDGTNIILPAAIISEGICFPKGPSYIFVAIDDYNNNVNNYYISAYADSINNNNILARINISTIVQQNGFYQTGEDDGFSTQVNRSRQYFGPVNIEKLRITLYDEYGRRLILNNMDWSCALMFECMYS